jgi:hypothetical protein
VAGHRVPLIRRGPVGRQIPLGLSDISLTVSGLTRQAARSLSPG